MRNTCVAVRTPATCPLVLEFHNAGTGDANLAIASGATTGVGDGFRRPHVQDEHSEALVLLAEWSRRKVHTGHRGTTAAPSECPVQRSYAEHNPPPQSTATLKRAIKELGWT